MEGRAASGWVDGGASGYTYAGKMSRGDKRTTKWERWWWLAGGADDVFGWVLHRDDDDGWRQKISQGGRFGFGAFRASRVAGAIFSFFFLPFISVSGTRTSVQQHTTGGG